MVMLVLTLLMAFLVRTSMGQGGPSFCRFPFIFRSVKYSACTTNHDPDGKLWCSTKTDNSNNHLTGNFRHCPSQNTGPSFCRFPFIFKNVQYSACTRDHDPDGQLWCSTKTDNLNNHLKGNFRHCTSKITSQQLRPAVIPSEEECGQSWRDNVVNGELTSAGDWPWLAALGKKINGKFSPFCGGTLITKQHVITAAHCFLIHKTQNTIVRLGEYNVDKDGDGAQDFNIIDELEGHYNRDTKENDIIVLKLHRPLSSYTDSIRAACLPYHLRNDKFEGKTLTVVGWGIFDNDIESTSPIPLQGNVAVVPVRDCLVKYNNLNKIDNRQMCAGTGGTDSCNGDSGGPLNFLDLSKSRFYVVGIVSFGPRFCGSSSRPGVYARVGSYLNWIEDAIKQML